MDEDDKALWQKLAETVRPLKRKRRPAPPPAAAPVPPAERPERPAKAERPAAKPAPVPAVPAAPPPLSHGDAPGADRRAFKRARRARLGDADVLDLHGMTQAEAHGALVRFLERARAEGRIRVRVITGKGRRGAGERGVLQDAVPQWLNEPGLRSFIQGFDYAGAEAGGAGALVILLRRAKRSSVRPPKSAKR